MGTKNNRQGNPDTLAGGLRRHIQSEVLVRGNAGQTFCMIVQNIDSKMISTSILTCCLLSFKVHLISKRFKERDGAGQKVQHIL